MTEGTPYKEPRSIRVEDGHVLVEGDDGAVVVMTPEAALALSRLLGSAGADALINKVLDKPL